MTEDEYNHQVAIKKWEIEREDKSKTWERRHSVVLKSEEALLQLATAAMRAPALIAAGSIAALLAFYFANSRVPGFDPTSFNIVLLYLMMALLISAVTTSTAYLTQYCYSRALQKEHYINDQPYIEMTSKAKYWRQVGYVLHYSSVTLIIASYICIILAGYKFMPLIATIL